MLGPLLLLTLSLLGPPLVLSQSQDDSCSCLNLAHVRTLIPDEATNAKQFLSTLRQYTELDLCKTKWQDLPVSTLNLWKIQIYRPRRGQDIRLGELVQKQAGELKNAAQKYFWKNWLESGKLNEEWTMKGSQLNEMIELSVNGIQDEIETWFTKFEKEWDDIFPDLGIVGTYALENRDKIFPAMTAFACAWSVKLPHAIFPPVYMEALENMDDKEKSLMIENILTKWMKEIILFQVPNLLKNVLNKLKPLLLGFVPDSEKFPSFLRNFQTGKQPSFENLIIRILEEAQTDEFLNRMDQLGKAACEKRKELFKFVFEQFLRIIREEHNFILRIFVDSNNKFDLNKFDKHWEQRIDESRSGGGSDIITRSFKNLGKAVENIETSVGTMVDIHSFLELLLPETSPRYCPEDAQIIKENAKMLTAGLIVYKFFYTDPQPHLPPGYGYQAPPPGYQAPPPPQEPHFPENKY